MPRIDRASADDARFVLEALIPDPVVRLRWLGLLVDAIRVAHQIHRGCWSVTLFDRKLRLNVGSIETVVFRPSHPMLVMDSGALSDANVQEIKGDPSLGYIDAYATVRGTWSAPLKYEYPALTVMTAHDELLLVVERAASMVKTRTPYARTHSPGVIEYLAQDFSTWVPQPDFRWQAGSAKLRR